MKVSSTITLQLGADLKCKWKWTCPVVTTDRGACAEKGYADKRSIAEKRLKAHYKTHNFVQEEIA